MNFIGYNAVVEAKNVSFHLQFLGVLIKFIQNTYRSKGLKRNAWKRCNLYISEQRRKSYRECTEFPIFKLLWKIWQYRFPRTIITHLLLLVKRRMKPILQLYKLVVNYVGEMLNFQCSFKLGKYGIKSLNCYSYLSSPSKPQLNCFRCLVKRTTWQGQWCFWNVFHSKWEIN